MVKNVTKREVNIKRNCKPGNICGGLIKYFMELPDSDAILIERLKIILAGEKIIVCATHKEK